MKQDYWKLNKKQYCHLYLSELWDETNLLKENTIKLKKFNNAKVRKNKSNFTALTKWPNNEKEIRKGNMGSVKNCKKDKTSTIASFKVVSY